MTRRQQWNVVIGFLALIYGVPFTQTIVEVVRGQAPQFLDVFRQLPTRPHLRAFEKELEEQSIFARNARPWIQYARFVIFRDAGEKVLVGKSDWLFYRPDVRYLVESLQSPPTGEKSEDPRTAITTFRDQLRARGIQLMVVPMPGKPSLYGAKLTRRLDDTREIASPTLKLIADLRNAGVEVVDLFELFGKQEVAGRDPLYLARDTHWSAGSAEIAASAVAERLQKLGWAQRGAVEYDVHPLVVPRRSDIARMTQVPLIEASYPAEQVGTRQVREKSGGIYHDDPAASVLVLGDSFLRIYQTDEPKAAGFIAHLARELRQPVASIVNDGGASTLVRQELARRPQLLQGKTVVIWEFVERDIRFGTEGWKLVALPSETAAVMPGPFRNP